MIKIYLSGAMDDVTEEEGKSWRRDAAVLLAHWDIEALNPYAFELKKATPADLVRQDLIRILSCQGVLANASQDVRMWGTPMEVFFAWTHHIPVVAFTGGTPVSPWLSTHADTTRTLKSAVETIRWQTIRL